MYTKDIFVLNRWILCCAGLWPPKTNNKILKFSYKTYSVTVFLFVNLYFTFTEFLSLTYTYGNIYDLIKNISFALTHFMGAVKVVFWYYKGEKLREIMTILETRKFSYGKCGEFDQEKIMANYRNIGLKYTLSFFLLAHATLSSSYIPPLIYTLKSFKEENITSLPERLPYYSWMPFKFDTPGSYLLALGYQAGPMFSYAYSIVGMDSLFMNIMNFIAAHLTIIQGAFLTIRVRVAENFLCRTLTEDGLYNTETFMKFMNLEMKKICRHLQLIFRVCEDLERVHNYLTLVQSMATLFILCTCLYLVSTTPVNNKQFYAEMVYMIAMGFQIFLYCWFGNEVTLKAKEVPDFIWNSDWLTADKEFKRSMSLTILRMKRPVYMTVGKFAPLTLATCVGIVKASYSFFAVIKNSGLQL